MNERIAEDDPRLTAYALGEMEAGERIAFEQLLERDAAARSRVDEIRATAAFLEAALEREPVAPVPDPSRARARAPIIRFPQFYYVVSGLAAACFALFFMVHQAREAGERDRQGAPVVVQHEPRRSTISQPPGNAIAIETAQHAALSEKFFPTSQSTTSTFPLRVTGDSYARVQDALRRGEKPRRDHVHIAEMINAFNYSWPSPEQGQSFATVLEAAPAPWAPRHRLVRVGLKGGGASDAVLARDAHVQVEFDPAVVSAWRLIGFERNGRAGVRGVSTGEVLRGDAVVTALYEVMPQEGAAVANAGWLTLNLRYTDASTGNERTVSARLDRIAPAFERASQDFQFIASVAAFGFFLKGTPSENAIAAEEVARWANPGARGRPDREQFVALVERARAL
jgi:hypothetical protein